MTNCPLLTILGRTNWRDRIRPFGIQQADRLLHVYVIGQTGTGKSTLLLNLMKQDAEAGRGFAFLDPHGDTVERVARSLPETRRHDSAYLNAPDLACEIGFNPFDGVAPSRRPLAASGLIEAFKKIWDNTWGPRLEHIFRNAVLTLLDQPEATLADIPRLFTDNRFREECLEYVDNPVVEAFWKDEFAKYHPRYKAEALAPLQNKLGAFLVNPTLQRILCRPKSSFRLRQIMDSGGILLVNLSKGQLGPDVSSLLGALLVSRFSLAAMSRAEIPEEERREFFLYLDEFQNYTTLTVAEMLSELRKYRLGITLAHQYLDQLEPEVRGAVFGNVGTVITFRVGVEDARFLVHHFRPEFEELDLTDLPNHSVYVRLMVKGQVSRPFSADTLPA